MNPNLVFCMAFAAVVGGLAAGLVVAAGWGVLLGFLAYSASGSVALLLSALYLGYRHELRADAERRRDEAAARAGTGRAA